VFVCCRRTQYYLAFFFLETLFMRTLEMRLKFSLSFHRLVSFLLPSLLLLVWPTSQRTQRGTPWRDRKGKQVNDDTRAYGSFFYFKNFEIVLPILLPLLLPSYLCVLCVLQTYSTFSIFFDRILVRSLTFLIRLNTTSPKSTL
jgi:hypothetical protein